VTLITAFLHKLSFPPPDSLNVKRILCARACRAKREKWIMQFRKVNFNDLAIAAGSVESESFACAKVKDK